MSQFSIQPFTRSDAIQELLLRLAVSGWAPGRRFKKNLPAAHGMTPSRHPIWLEIVSHCWKYSHFLLYQLSSLVNYPPQTLQVTFTVFYSEADADAVHLLEFFRSRQAPNVVWNFQSLPTDLLFRRAIGRNLAAKSSRADWVWFTDCDVVFHRGALDALAEQLVERRDILVYPRQMLCSTLLEMDDPLIVDAAANPAVRDIDVSQFTVRDFDRAIGPIQIVHGDVARACGYCGELGVYQKGMPYWAKCHEDRAFRWLLGTSGVPINVPNVLLIRHVEKGRYPENSQFSALRRTVKRVKFSLLGR